MPNPVYAKTPENPPHCHVPLRIKLVSCWVRLFTAGLITYLAKAERNPGKSKLFSDSCRVRKWGCAPAIYPLWRLCSEGDPTEWENYLLLSFATQRRIFFRYGNYEGGIGEDRLLIFFKAWHIRLLTKTLIFSHWKRAFRPCFYESWVYKYGPKNINFDG